MDKVKQGQTFSLAYTLSIEQHNILKSQDGEILWPVGAVNYLVVHIGIAVCGALYLMLEELRHEGIAVTGYNIIVRAAALRYEVDGIRIALVKWYAFFVNIVSPNEMVCYEATLHVGMRTYYEVGIAELGFA